MLAETVSIDGGTLLVILLVLLVFVALAIALVVFGFVLAPRAGRGSRNALGWWIAILIIESFYVLGSVAAILGGDFSVIGLAPVAIVAGQVALYLQARKEAGR
jgi:lipopolysaccharide export LptBFGC system permease protein LptF